MSAVLTTYSAKDLSGSISGGLLSVPIDLSGMAQHGFSEIVVRMSVDRSVLQTAADGAVVPSVVPGDMGVIEVECWQTSVIHQELLGWYNLIHQAELQGDVSNWFGSNILIRNIVDGSQHYGQAVAPMKIPDKPYGDQAAKVRWSIVCCNLTQQ